MKKFSDYVLDDILTDYRTYGNMFFSKANGNETEKQVFSSIDLLIYLKENPALDKPFFTDREDLKNINTKEGYYSEVLDVIYFINSAGSSPEFQLEYIEPGFFIDEILLRREKYIGELIACQLMEDYPISEITAYKTDLYKMAVSRINNIFLEIFED